MKEIDPARARRRRKTQAREGYKRVSKAYSSQEPHTSAMSHHQKDLPGKAAGHPVDFGTERCLFPRRRPERSLRKSNRHSIAAPLTATLLGSAELLAGSATVNDPVAGVHTCESGHPRRTSDLDSIVPRLEHFVAEAARGCT